MSVKTRTKKGRRPRRLAIWKEKRRRADDAVAYARAVLQKRFWQSCREWFAVHRRFLLQSLVIHLFVGLLLSFVLIFTSTDLVPLGTTTVSLSRPSRDTGREKLNTVKLAQQKKEKQTKKKPKTVKKKRAITNTGERRDPMQDMTDGDRNRNKNTSGDPAGDDEFDKRRRGAKGRTGAITATIVWNDFNDLDIAARLPNGTQIWYRNRDTPSGALDVDRNASSARLTARPVENIYIREGKNVPGRYGFAVQLYRRRRPGAIPFRVKIQTTSETRIYEGSFAASAGGGLGKPQQLVCVLELNENGQAHFLNPQQFRERQRKAAQIKAKQEREARPVWLRARAHMRRGNYASAKSSLQRIVNQWPETTVGKQAKLELSRWRTSTRRRR